MSIIFIPVFLIYRTIGAPHSDRQEKPEYYFQQEIFSNNSGSPPFDSTGSVVRQPVSNNSIKGRTIIVFQFNSVIE